MFRNMKKLFATTCVLTLLASPGFLAAQSQDTTAPSITDVSVDQSSIDTSSAAETVVATLTLTDDLAGVVAGSLNCQSASAQTVAGSGTLTSGTSTSGTWTVPIKFPRYSEHGSWACKITLVDAVFNHLYQTDLSGFTFTGTITNGP